VLVVLEGDDVHAVAMLPASLPPGSYVLRVTNTTRPRLPTSDPFEVALGAVGPQGPAGADGASGLPRLPGADGAMGLPGLQGDDGAPGSQGEPGLAGAPGAPGAQGESVVGMSLGVGDVKCPYGGSSFTAGGLTTYACNGVPGAPGFDGAPGAEGRRDRRARRGPRARPAAWGPTRSGAPR